MPEERRDLTRDDILNCDDQTKDEIDIPGWGGVVHIRELTDAEMSLFNETQKRNVINTYATMAMLSIVDSEGKQLFTKENVPVIEKKSFSILQDIFDKCRSVNGLDADAEESVKNSEETQEESGVLA